MDLKNLILITKRHIKGILLIAAVIVAATVVFYLKYNAGAATSATIFLNIGSKANHEQANFPSPMDQVEAADMFTETIAGWFKNKELLSRIEKQSLTSVSVTARKQEKQNLLVTFKTKDEPTAKKITQSIQENLLADVGSYNRNTGSYFQIALFSASYEPISPIIFTAIILLGLILGLGFGFGLFMLIEKINDKLIYDYQAELILGVNAIEKLSSKTIKSGQLNYLSALIHNIPYRNLSFIGLGYNPEDLESALKPSIPEHKLESFKFPEDTNDIIAGHGSGNVIIAKLGTSQIGDLQKIKTLLTDKYYLIIRE